MSETTATIQSILPIQDQIILIAEVIVDNILAKPEEERTENEQAVLDIFYKIKEEVENLEETE